MDYANINGHRLRYHLEGEGPLVVFGHGLMGSIDQVEEREPRLDDLRTRIRLLVYDARGHGGSTGPEDADGYTWETLGRDMSAFIDHAGEERAIVGGGSMGAATALWVALEQPERVRGLVIVMPPPLGHEPVRGEAEKQAIAVLDLLAAAVQNFGLEKTVELAKLYPGFAPSPEEAEQRARWLLAQNPRTILHAIRGVVRSPFHDPAEYQRIRVPTLVIAHEGDGLHPARAARLLAGSIPGARLSVAPESGWWQRHPDAFLAEVTAFLDRVG